MDLFSIPINQNNFPAKLWRLVNNSTNLSIYWDNAGDGVIIEQGLFEQAFLSPQKTFESGDLFKTTNFASFIRQLNLYGFRKVANTFPNKSIAPTEENGIQHHYFNQNFKRNHPELLMNLKRLTTSNKAKIEAGLEVNCRPPNLYHRLLVDCNRDKKERMKKRGGSVFSGQTQQASSHPYHPNRPQPTKEYDRTPIPPRNWVMGHGAASSPTIFYTDKGTPVPLSLIHRFPGGASSTTPLHIQQELQGFASPGQKFTNFISPHAQYRPGFYSPVCQCCPSGSVASDLTDCGPQTPSFSQFGYYKPNCPVSFPYPESQNPDFQSSENQEKRRSEINLDEVFQIVDELQVSPEVVVVKVGTPEKQVPVSQPATSVHRSTLPVPSQLNTSVSSSSEPASTDANPPTPCKPTITAASENVPQGIAVKADGAAGQPVKVEQMEEPIVPVPDVTPEDATQMSPDRVSSGKGKDTQILDVEVSNTPGCDQDAKLSWKNTRPRQQSKYPSELDVEVACKEEF